MPPLGDGTASVTDASSEPSSEEKHETPIPEEEEGGAGGVGGTAPVERSQGGDDGGDDDGLDEAAVCRRVSEATVHALDRVLEFRYSTPDHPHGPPNKIFTFGCAGSASNYSYQIRVQPKHFSINCSSPLRIPSGQRVRVAEFIVRVNFSLVLGHFDLDFDDGELRFRIVHDVVSGLESDRIVRFFATTLAMMDRHFPAIMQLTYGNMTPEEAVASCERDDNAPSTAEAVEQ